MELSEKELLAKYGFTRHRLYPNIFVNDETGIAITQNTDPWTPIDRRRWKLQGKYYPTMKSAIIAALPLLRLKPKGR